MSRKCYCEVRSFLPIQFCSDNFGMLFNFKTIGIREEARARARTYFG